MPIENKMQRHKKKAESLLSKLKSAMDEHDWSHMEIATKTGVDRKTVAKFLADQIIPQISTLEKLETILDSVPEEGFAGKTMYRAIARGMRAEVNNENFLKKYRGEYRILRAHVPSGRLMISKLDIRSEDNEIITYTHTHPVSELPGVGLEPETSTGAVPHLFKNYSGFLFNCGQTAFLISTARDTRSIKEMVFDLPEYSSEDLKSSNDENVEMFKGLLLTVATSKHSRMPFASVLQVIKVSDAWDKEKVDLLTPRLADWTDLIKIPRPREFVAPNYGILDFGDRWLKT